MKITRSKYNPAFFDVTFQLGGQELTIKGCKIVNGSKGPFVSFPSRKDDSGKYWPHVYAGDGIQSAIIAAVDAPQPKQATKQAPPQATQGSGFDDMEDAPF